MRPNSQIGWGITLAFVGIGLMIGAIVEKRS